MNRYTLDILVPFQRDSLCLHLFFCLPVVCPRSFVVMGAFFDCLATLLGSLRRGLYRCCGYRRTLPTNKQQVPISSSEPSVHCLNDPVSLSLLQSIEFSLTVKLRCLVLRGGRTQVQVTRTARPITTARTSLIVYSKTGFTNYVAKSL